MSMERVRKLLALAADQEGTPEGDSAARVARRLIADRGLQLAGLSDAQRERSDPFSRKEILLGGPGHWRCRLVVLVARHVGCQAGYQRGRGKATLYGRRSAVEVAEYLYLVLGRALTRERVMWTMGAGASLPEAERTRRVNDFTRSALLALSTRLEELREQERSGAPEQHALVRSHGRGLESWMRVQGVRLESEPPFPFAYDAEGYRAGFRLPLLGAVAGG